MKQKSKRSKGLHKGPLSAIILIEVIPHEHLNVLKAVKKELEGISGVKEVWGVFGTWDLSATVEASSFEELKDKVIDEVRAVPGVGKTETLPRFPL
ncbi:MAG: Lrp/AsnC family transcriptional regulator [Candidatus Thorarchaeota archaeon]